MEPAQKCPTVLKDTMYVWFFKSASWPPAIAVKKFLSSFFTDFETAIHLILV